jgi:magnesium chelatase subunit D
VLPGGGGTPLARGLKLAHEVAAKASSRGQSSLTVVLTDGRANIALDGRAERREAGEDAHRMATGFRASGLRTLLIDTARRPQDTARMLARSMGGEYLALPHGGAQALSAAVSLRLGAQGDGSEPR